MTRSGATTRPAGRLDPATVASVLARAGLVVLALTVPVAGGTIAGLLAAATSPADGIALALAALDGPLLAGFGLSWLFHVTTLAGLCGCWLVGAALLLSGLYD